MANLCGVLLVILLGFLLMLQRSEAYLAWEQADAALDEQGDGDGRRVPASRPFGALTSTHSAPPCAWLATEQGWRWRASNSLPCRRSDGSLCELEGVLA
jgi:hypothetical protein